MNLFKRKKTKHMIEESIMFAIDELRSDIERSIDVDKNRISANSIKALAEAYDIVHRGKRGEY